MAKVLTGVNGTTTHLRGVGGTLCGDMTQNSDVTEGELTCPDCADIALTAIYLSTKKERKLWKDLTKK